MAKKPALGKGLSALIGSNSMASNSNGYFPNLPINLIVPNPYQPRVEIQPEALVELADSIRSHGVIEPLLVTKKNDTIFELIAGERRWRAAQLAGLSSIPVVVKEASPQEMLEMAIVENIQRQDLNPLEEALAFEQLQKEFKLTHEEISKKMGVSRPAIANKIRLLALPKTLKKALLEEKISEGHARALLGLDTEDKMMGAFNLIQRDNLSVRAIEELVRRMNKDKKTKLKSKSARILDDRTIRIENDLKRKFGKHVMLTRSKKGGKIVIPFKNDDELDGILKNM